MDPDITLDHIREIVANYIEGEKGTGIEDSNYDVENLSNLLRDLDDWLSKGGFLPTDWS